MTEAMQPSDLCVETVRRLVGFDTVSSNSNLALIEWIEAFLARHGVASRLSYDPERRKANLFATLGPQGSGGLILAGHTDTVPVTGQVWTSPPFEGVVRDGKLYGRGAVDMKGFIGTCLALVPRMARAKLTRPIHLAFTFDEETTMLGARTLVADLRDQGIAPLACLVGEPTSLKAVIGHKGRRALRCCVRGLSAHSSLPTHGANAIEYAAMIVERLREMAERQKSREERHYGYDVPYSTIVTTRIQGGLSTNTIPEECAFDFEFRHLPWTDPDQLEAEVRDFALQQVQPQMEREFADCAIRFERESDLPAFGAASSSEGLAPGASELLRLIGRRDAPLGYVAFATEASWFQHAGIPTVVCGPGSIEQAHKPDEYVSLAQLAECELLLAGLIESLQ